MNFFVVITHHHTINTNLNQIEAAKLLRWKQRESRDQVVDPQMYHSLADLEWILDLLSEMMLTRLR